MLHLHYLLLIITLLALLPASAQTKKEQIAGLQAKADSLRTELARSQQQAEDDERARNALLHRLDTLQEGRARDAASHARRVQQLQEERDMANRALHQAKDELAAMQAAQAANRSADPYAWFVPLKKEILAVVTDDEAAKKVLSAVDLLLNDHFMRLRFMEVSMEEGWHGEEDIGISIAHHSKQFIFLQVSREGFYGGAHPESESIAIAFRKANGAQFPLTELLVPHQKAQLAGLLQQKVRAMIPEVAECLGVGAHEDPYDLADWSPSDSDFSVISIGKGGVSFDLPLLSYADRACEPGLALDKREAVPFFVPGVWE
jgi:hypothetical protein